MTTPDMTTKGIEAVFLETHNWGKAAKFFQSLGFELEFSTDHNSGQLRKGDGPYVSSPKSPRTESHRCRSCCRWPTLTRSAPILRWRWSRRSRTPISGPGR
jgi:hypothetical protein